MRQCPRDKGNHLESDSDKKEDGPRRVTRALVKTKNTKEYQAGKLVWGFFAGWWPGKYIKNNDRILHAISCDVFLAN